MASSSGTTTTTTTTTTTNTTSSGGSYPIQSSGSEEDLQLVMDQKKRKRMISNRESARRSRLRKQQHLDELAILVSQLRKEKNQIISSVSITTHHYMSVEEENSVLRAQVAELSHRLQSLNEIIAFRNQSPPVDFVCGFAEEIYGGGSGGGGGGGGGAEFVDEFMSYVFANQPILASADMIQY